MQGFKQSVKTAIELQSPEGDTRSLLLRHATTKRNAKKYFMKATEMFSLRFSFPTPYTKAIEVSIAHVEIGCEIIADSTDNALIVHPNTEWNESDDCITIRDIRSAFLVASRLAHTFPSDAVDAGLVDEKLRFVEAATLTDAEELLSDGRQWICSELLTVSAADVLLHQKLARLNLDAYPYLKAYCKRPLFN